MEKIQVLITGGNGFIGSHLCERLIEAGDQVTLFDIHFTSNTDHIECEKIRGDITDFPVVLKAIQGQDIVFHLAAVSRVIWGQQDPVKCWQTNILGTMNVLEACSKADKKPTVFYASSREVYGDPHYYPVDEAHPKDPKSFYGLSKLYAEKACLAYNHTFGLNTVILRFSNVYGSSRDLPNRVIPKFMRKALGGEDLPLYGGEQILDFNFIDDTVTGVIHTYVESLNGNGEVVGNDFHFVSGNGIAISDLAHKIIDLVDSSSKVTKAEPQAWDVHKFIGDPEKASKMLGYRSRIRLDEGLAILEERLQAHRES